MPTKRVDYYVKNPALTNAGRAAGLPLREPTFVAQRLPRRRGGTARRRRPFGLGDWVETWAKPIGRQIDRATRRLPARYRTHFGRGKCGCAGRKKVLNVVLPDLRSWAAWKAAPGRAWGALSARVSAFVRQA
jgi:hypothetical protein